MADLIDIASKEIGYKESAGNQTKYGAFTGTNGLAWCHAFVSWCANQAKISTRIVPKTASTTYGMNWYKSKNRFQEKLRYTPSRNDLIYFKSDGASHVGIVEKVEGSTVYTIEGNTSDKVARRSYPLTYHTITGYGQVNKYITNSNTANSSTKKTNNRTGSEEIDYLKKMLAKNEKSEEVEKKTFEIKSISANNNFEVTLFFTHKKKSWNLPVQNGLKITLERKGSPGKMEFTTIADKKHKMYCGDSVNFLVDGKPFFYGYIFTLKPSADGTISVIAYDQLRYFKNKDAIFYKKKTATKVLKQIANTYKLKVGKLENTKQLVSRNELGATLFDIMENCLAETLQGKGKIYTLYDDYGKLMLRQPWKVNILIDEETGQGYDYSCSIDGEVYNQIKLVYENKKKKTLDTYVAKSTKNINKWGVLQMYDKLDSPKGAKLKAKVLLQMYNKQSRTLSINGAFGSIQVRAGCLLPVIMDLYDKKVSSYMLVDRVVHNFENGLHTMDLDLSGGGFDGK